MRYFRKLSKKIKQKINFLALHGDKAFYTININFINDKSLYGSPEDFGKIFKHDDLVYHKIAEVE